MLLVVMHGARSVTKDGLGLSHRPRRLHVSVVMRLRHVRHVSELGLSDGPWSWLRPGNLS